MDEKDYYGIRAKSSTEALRLAASSSQIKVMKKLLDDGVDINGVSGRKNSTALSTAAGYGLIRSVDFLIENGADVDQPGENNMTPLMRACSIGKVKGSRVALRLLEAQADATYVRSSDGMTALKFAVEEASPAVIQKLIDCGAEVDGPDGTDQTALMIAARANNVDALKVLVKNGADVSIQCGLKWAEKRTARGLAELENRKQAAAYLASCE